jgi:hypothetical protein
MNKTTITVDDDVTPTKYIIFAFMLDYQDNVEERSVDVYNHTPDPNKYEWVNNSNISEADGYRTLLLPPNQPVGRSKPFNKKYFGCYKLKSSDCYSDEHYSDDEEKDVQEKVGCMHAQCKESGVCLL